MMDFSTLLSTALSFGVLFLAGFFASRYIRYRRADKIRREKVEFIRSMLAERINMMDDKE